MVAYVEHIIRLCEGFLSPFSREKLLALLRQQVPVLQERLPLKQVATPNTQHATRFKLHSSRFTYITPHATRNTHQ